MTESTLPALARPVRWAGVLFAVSAAVLVPWTVWLAVSLPERSVQANYNLAWAGFDVILLAGVVWTAVSALRCSRWLAPAASSTAALLLVDAWTDVVTSATADERLAAVIMAAAVELPLAVVCGWLAAHAADITERRVLLLLQVDGDSVGTALRRLRRRGTMTP